MEKSANDLQQEVTPSRLENEDGNLNLKMQGTQLNNAALEGTILEHELSILECIKAYPTAIFWALMVSPGGPWVGLGCSRAPRGVSGWPCWAIFVGHGGL